MEEAVRKRSATGDAMGAKTLCLPMEQPDLPPDTPCFVTGKPAKNWALWGRVLLTSCIAMYWRSWVAAGHDPASSRARPPTTERSGAGLADPASRAASLGRLSGVRSVLYSHIRLIATSGS